MSQIETVAEALPGQRERSSLELGEREPPDPLTVHPVELLVIERCGRVRDACEREGRDDLVEVHDLAAVVGRPAQQREVVADRLGEVAGDAEVLERHGAVPLGQLRSVGPEDQREVRVHRLLLGAEGAPEREHAVGRVDEVLAPDHMGDLHGEVVDGVREEEDRRAVGPHDDEVADRGPLHPDLAADLVEEAARPLVGRPEAERARTAFGSEPLALGRRQVTAVPVVAGLAPRSPGCRRPCLQLLLGAGALVDGTGFEQLLGRGAVLGGALALAHRTLVPVEPEPAHRVLDPEHPLLA